MKSFTPVRALTALSLFAGNLAPTQAVTLDASQPDSVRSAAKTVAEELVSLYATIDGSGVHVVSGIPGLLTYPPYYWWEAGAMFGSLIEYWYYTNDTQYNDMVRDGILAQIGDSANLMPANQSKDEGNDDQLFWAFTVMSAAELGFEDPKSDQPGWLALAQSVMNQLISRWDTSLCDGGMRWQIYQWLPGYNYKNLAANGGMFQLGARLAKYTNNETYADWATKAYDWMAGTPLMTDDGHINDGMDGLKGCKDADQTQWTYNYGIMLAGSAYMYNYTNGSDLWAGRLSKYLNNTGQFFRPNYNNVMVEVCEPSQKCNVDQWSFKGYLARWLATTAQLAPFTRDQIMPWLAHSGEAAAQQCTGGEGQNQCGSRWYQDFDGNTGVGQQMSALQMIQSNLILDVQAPYSADTGGTSEGNPAAGTGQDDPNVEPVVPVTAGDKAGASILTIAVISLVVGGGWWLTVE